jgi:type II restriction enzyme
MIVDYNNLKKKVKGTPVPKPLSGTLSGHAAGEPFDKHVYKEIKKTISKGNIQTVRILE